MKFKSEKGKFGWDDIIYIGFSAFWVIIGIIGVEDWKIARLAGQLGISFFVWLSFGIFLIILSAISIIKDLKKKWDGKKMVQPITVM